jgi:hypothetical protein
LLVAIALGRVGQGQKYGHVQGTIGAGWTRQAAPGQDTIVDSRPVFGANT